MQRTLNDALQLRAEGGLCTIFRDHASGLEHILESQSLADQGLQLELGAFQYRALIDFRQVHDDGTHPYVRLARGLDGAGVPSIEEALLDETLGPLHKPVYAAVEPGSVAYFLPGEAPDAQAAAQLRGHLVEKLERVLAGLVLVEGPKPTPAGLIERLTRRYERAILQPPVPDSSRQLWLSLLILEAVSAAAGEHAPRALRLDRPLLAALRAAGLDEPDARRRVELVLLAASRAGKGLSRDLLALLGAEPAHAFLEVHEHGGTIWFSKPRFEELCEALETAAIGEERAAGAAPSGVSARTLGQLAADSGYRFEPLLAALDSQAGPAPGKAGGGQGPATP